MIAYILAALSFSVASGAIGYHCFCTGYNLGWEERHNDMILPRNIVRRVNKDLDDQETRNRHSAMDPKKPVWH